VENKSKQIINISETVPLSNIQISYNIVKAKVDEIEKVYVTDNDYTQNKELDAKTLHTNLKGVSVFTIEFIKTNETPVNVILSDRYLKLVPKKTIIRDSEHNKYISYKFEEFNDLISTIELGTSPLDLYESLDREDEVNTNDILEIGTIFRVVNGVRQPAEYTYYIVREGNEVCRIPNSKTTQVLLMERGLKSRDVVVLEDIYLKAFNITGNCPSRASEWIPRFELDTGFATPELPDFEDEPDSEPEEQILKIQIVNTGSNGENCFPICGGGIVGSTPTPSTSPPASPKYPATVSGALAKAQDKKPKGKDVGIIARCYTCYPDSSNSYQATPKMYLSNYTYLKTFNEGKSNLRSGLKDRNFKTMSKTVGGHKVRINVKYDGRDIPYTPKGVYQRFGNFVFREEVDNQGIKSETKEYDWNRANPGTRIITNLRNNDLANDYDGDKSKFKFVDYYDFEQCRNISNIEDFMKQYEENIRETEFDSPRPKLVPKDSLDLTVPDEDEVENLNLGSSGNVTGRDRTELDENLPINIKTFTPKTVQDVSKIKPYKLPIGTLANPIETSKSSQLGKPEIKRGIAKPGFDTPFRTKVGEGSGGSSEVNPTGGNTAGCFQCS